MQYILIEPMRKMSMFSNMQEFFLNYRLYQKVVCLIAFPFCMCSNIFFLLKKRFNLWEIFLKYD